MRRPRKSRRSRCSPAEAAIKSNFAFAYLGSGSRGNAALIRCGETTIMVDCGFKPPEAERRLARLGVKPESLTAILVTHEHSDHIGGVGRFAKRHGIAVWMTAGTFDGWQKHRLSRAQRFNPHESFTVGEIEVRPYPVPHDAREPSQFVFSDGARKLGVLSDAGSITPHMRASLTACDALLLECNHDPQMLADGPYPPSLQERVGGDYGHLSNRQAGELLKSIDCSRLQHLALIHLSQKNNTEALARAAVAEALNCGVDDMLVAHQDDGLSWRELR